MSSQKESSSPKNYGSSGAIVRGFAKALPSRAVTNQDLSQMMDTTDEWIVQRTGIKTRYWVEPPCSTSDLAVQSSEKTTEALKTREIDAVIAATLTPDFGFPGIGVQVQAKMGLPCVPAYDIRNQCSGFLYGLEMANALIQNCSYKRILLVGAEVHSTGLDISTRGRDVAVLFGDGAGSCVVQSRDVSTEDSGLGFEVLGTELHADGNHIEKLWCEHPGSAHFPTRVSAEMIEQGTVFPKMDGKKVFENAVRRMSEVSLSLLAQCDLKPKDVKLFVPHQANIRINQMVGKHIGLADEQVFSTIEQYGNTTAATIPIGMCDALAAGLLKKGDIVLSAAFGSGFTWGAAVLRAVD